MTPGIYTNANEQPLRLPRYRHRVIKSLVKQLRRRERDAEAISICRRVGKDLGAEFGYRRSGHGYCTLYPKEEGALVISGWHELGNASLGVRQCIVPAELLNE